MRLGLFMRMIRPWDSHANFPTMLDGTVDLKLTPCPIVIYFTRYSTNFRILIELLYAHITLLHADAQCRGMVMQDRLKYCEVVGYF